MRGSKAAQAMVKCTSLAAAHDAHPVRIHIWHFHNNPGKLGCIEKDLSEEQLFRRTLQCIIQSTNNMPVKGISGDTSTIFR